MSPKLKPSEIAGPMYAKEFRRALDRLRWTQGDAASFLGVSLRTINGYAAGEPIRPGDAMWLRYMVARGLTMEMVQRFSDRAVVA